MLTTLRRSVWGRAANREFAVPVRPLVVALALIAATPALAQGPPKAARFDLYGDPLPDGALARMGTVRLRDGDFFIPLVFSPDGRWLVSAGGRLISWDTTTGRARWTVDPGSELNCAAYSPDGSWVVTAGTNLALLTVWDANTGKARYKRKLGEYVKILAVS